MSGELGKASLDLEANLTEFERNVEAGRRTASGMGSTLEHVAAIADLANHALNDVGISASQAAESRTGAEAILSGVRGISEESLVAAREIDRVKISEEQAAESEASGGLINHVLNAISRNADQAKRKLTEVKIEGGVPGRSGVGVGPFGSGFGRIGVLGTAIGAAALTGPAAGPAAVGLLASIPTLAAGGAGALGVLALAFKGVGAAIGGSKKAFDDLGPSAKQFVLTVRSLDGWFDKLRQTAGAALFPGLTAGLKAALSPGTLGVITSAVTMLGHALGAAGAAWGRYFGSKEFQSILGPLMQSAAHTIGALSDAVLHLFDALGVIARAAIPFTNWLTSAIDKGSKLVDSWLQAKDATGALGGAMNQAETSLRLVGGLLVALLKVVGALGIALYPVAKVAVKALTDGLDYLAGVIDRNRQTITQIAQGALRGFIGVVKLAATGVGVLWDALSSILGHKGVIIAAVAAIGVAITLALGPEAAAILGALVAIGLIKRHWAAIVVFFKDLGKEILNAFEYVWYLIEKGALLAALQVVEPFSHLPGVLGGWARKAKNSMQGELDRIRPPNMNWSKYAAHDGAVTGAAWTAAFQEQLSKNRKKLQQQAFNLPPESFAFWLRGHPGGTHAEYEQYVKSVKGEEHIAKEATKPKHKHHHTTTDPTTAGPNPFGPPPPFTTGTGTGSVGPSVIPQSVAMLDALAGRQDQQASASGYKGKQAREHLFKEIGDLQKADKILEEKLKHAHGKKRTELYNALTANLKKIAEARKRLSTALKNNRADELQFAVDQAKNAVDSATVGSKAYDRAVKAEEKALRDQIKYLDKVAHNRKLSLKERDAAIRKEDADRKQLHALLKQTAISRGQNEAQFLSTFNQLQSSLGSNATPVDHTGKMATHLYEMKHDIRGVRRHLREIRDRGRFPEADAGMASAAAVGAT